MSRFRSVFSAVTSSYIGLGAGAVYSFASTVVALTYLSKAEFGLWALITALVGYFTILEMAMSGAMARWLIDFKDDKPSGKYGTIVTTGWLVLAVQAAIVLVVGFLFADPAGRLLDIPVQHQRMFTLLLRWQCAILAWNFFARPSAHMLQAHHRLDTVNYLQAFGLAVNFAVLWGLFRAGLGLWSLPWAYGVAAVFNALGAFAACRWLRVFPPSGAWGRPSWVCFKELFGYGKDLLLVALGGQLVSASQTVIVTRFLGLEMAAAWSIGTRMFGLAVQLVVRISEMAAPVICEMLNRGERTRLARRYEELTVVKLSFSGWAAIAFALCNSAFVTVWTQGRIQWSPGTDVLLGVLLVVTAAQHSHGSFILYIRDFGLFRWIYLIEAVVFLGAAPPAAVRFDLPGMVACSILCMVTVSLSYGVRRVSRYFGRPVREVAVQWMKPMLTVVTVLGPLAVGVWWLTGPLPPVGRLAVHGVFALVAGGAIFLRYGIPRAFQDELLGRVPKQLGQRLRLVIGR